MEVAIIQKGSARTESNYLTGIVYRSGYNLAESCHHAVRVNKNMTRAVCGVCLADNIAGVVNYKRNTACTAERAQIRIGSERTVKHEGMAGRSDWTCADYRAMIV